MRFCVAGGSAWLTRGPAVWAQYASLPSASLEPGLSRKTGSSQGGSCTLGVFSGPCQAFALGWAPLYPGRGGGDWEDLGLQPWWAHQALPSALRLTECIFGPEHMLRLAADLSMAKQLTELE